MARYRLKDFIHDCKGAILAWVAIWLPILVGCAALAIDMAYGYWTRNETQVAASAAALAGVAKLVDEDESDVADDRVFQAEALEYAFKNMPFSRYGTVINSSCGVDAGTGAIDPGLTSLGEFDAGYDAAECTDVKAGFWDQANPSLVPVFVAHDCTGFEVPWPFCPYAYDPPNMELNAVRVAAKRSQDNSNPLLLFMAGVLGLPQADVQASAVAKLAIGLTEYYGPDTCLFATSPDEPESLYVFGDAALSLVNCDAQVNSDDPCAFKLQGDPTMTMADTNSYVHVVGPGEDGAGYCEVGNSVNFDPWVDENGDGIADYIGTDEPYVDDPYEGRDPKTAVCANTYDDPYCDLEVVDPSFWDPSFCGAANRHCDFGVDTNFDGIKEYDGVDQTALPDCVDGSSATCKTDVTVMKLVDGVLVPTIETTVRAFPGTYYADTTKFSMQFNGIVGVEFYPGEYVVYGGEFKVGATTAVSVYEPTLVLPPSGETGVGFYLTGNAATLNLTGGGDLVLSAPTNPDSPLLGYLFFEDPNPAYQPPGTMHSIRGGTGSLYQGSIYLQNDIEFKGTTDTGVTAGGDCFTVIANTIYFNGTNDFQLGNNCADGGYLPTPAPNITTVLSLVE